MTVGYVAVPGSRSIRGKSRFTTRSALLGRTVVFDVAAGMRIGEKNPVFPA
jgi:hypothetical protein